MGTIEQANRIITACMSGDSDQLKFEIDCALLPVFEINLTTVQHEEKEVFESVLHHLRSSGLKSSAIIEPDFTLLCHLRSRWSTSNYNEFGPAM